MTIVSSFYVSDECSRCFRIFLIMPVIILLRLFSNYCNCNRTNHYNIQFTETSMKYFVDKHHYLIPQTHKVLTLSCCAESVLSVCTLYHILHTADIENRNRVPDDVTILQCCNTKQVGANSFNGKSIKLFKALFMHYKLLL